MSMFESETNNSLSKVRPKKFSSWNKPANQSENDYEIELEEIYSTYNYQSIRERKGDIYEFLSRAEKGIDVETFNKF